MSEYLVELINRSAIQKNTVIVRVIVVLLVMVLMSTSLLNAGSRVNRRINSALFLSCVRPRLLAQRAGNVRFMSEPSASTESFSTAQETQGTANNRRFWLRETRLPLHLSSLHEIVQSIQAMVEGFPDKYSLTGEGTVILKGLACMANGLIMLPQFGTIIPVHSGRVQMQHITHKKSLLTSELPANEDSGNLLLVVCGFSARAQDDSYETESYERKVDETRKLAMDKALIEIGLGLTAEDLLGEEFSGLSPGRIYRSFVCPRPSRGPDLSPIHKRAISIANQIQFAVRQVRADRAIYLRNTDRTETANITHDSHKTHPVVLVLDNLRSAENVGGIFRSAETAGAAEVVTCGITPHPPHPKLSKTALQSLDLVRTRHFASSLEATKTLKEEGYTIAVLETTSMSRSYSSVTYPKKTALVFGNEVTGVDTELIELADLILEIPTYGVKNSLNVASAASISLFEVIRQWNAHNI